VYCQAEAWPQMKQPVRPLFTSQAKEEVLDRLIQNFWMESNTREGGNYATPISEDLIMIKMKKQLKIPPDSI
jgi:hypothetical protein